MKTPFDKVVVWTDIHLGLRNNERRHNYECLKFVEWMIQEAKQFGAKNSIFMGDFHHYRSSVQTSTLNYSITIFEMLGEAFDNHYQIIGNHDLFYKDKREINSVEFARDIDNIHIINEITKLDDITLVPWLVENEHKKMPKIETPYVFGHFEIPNFLMNAMVAMPDIGKLKNADFHIENQQIFSGHFHRRQQQRNEHGAEITYIGNCFPHNYSDAGDDERGIMLLEFGKNPIFKKWPGAPKYRVLNLSTLLEDPDKYIDDKTSAKVTIDVDITYEEANFIRETLIKEYKVRELKLIPSKQLIEQATFDDGITFESVDQIVIDQLDSMDVSSLDKELLIDIYNGL